MGTTPKQKLIVDVGGANGEPGEAHNQFDSTAKVISTPNLNLDSSANQPSWSNMVDAEVGHPKFVMVWTTTEECSGTLELGEPNYPLDELVVLKYEDVAKKIFWQLFLDN